MSSVELNAAQPDVIIPKLNFFFPSFNHVFLLSVVFMEIAIFSIRYTGVMLIITFRTFYPPNEWIIISNLSPMNTNKRGLDTTKSKSVYARIAVNLALRILIFVGAI